MKKTLSSLSLLVTLALAPGLVAHAEAGQHWNRGARYGGRSAWAIVQSDPCLANEYARFARDHHNPNKRARVVERLAREGCDRDAYARTYGVRRYDESYAYADDGYDGRIYGSAPNAYRYSAPTTGVAVVVHPLLNLFIGQ